MAPVTPNLKNIRGFRTEAAFESWLRANHDRVTEIWLKIHKTATGFPTVTYAQALDVALCWGWIDGIKKSYAHSSSGSHRGGRKASGARSTVTTSPASRPAAA